MSQPATPLTPARQSRQRDRRSLWAGLVVALLHGGLLLGLMQATQRPLPAAGAQLVPGPVLMTLRLLPLGSGEASQASPATGAAPAAPPAAVAAWRSTPAAPLIRPAAPAAGLAQPGEGAAALRQAPEPAVPTLNRTAPMGQDWPAPMAAALSSTAPGPSSPMPSAPQAAAALAQGAGALPLAALATGPQSAAKEAATLAAARPDSRPSAGPWVAARVLPGQALPVYPEAAREDGLQGTVHLQVQLDRGGQVLTVDWLRRSGVMLLDLAARDAVRDWRFEPARQGGEPVASALALSIRFQLTQPVSVTRLAVAGLP